MPEGRGFTAQDDNVIWRASPSAADDNPPRRSSESPIRKKGILTSFLNTDYPRSFYFIRNIFSLPQRNIMKQSKFNVNIFDAGPSGVTASGALAGTGLCVALLSSRRICAGA
jgi:hypothetical protein